MAPMPRPLPMPVRAIGKQSKPHYPDSPVVDKVHFGAGLVGIAPGIVQVTAPSGHHFPWTRREALAMADVLEPAAPDLAHRLREAARACFDKWAGARRSEGAVVVVE